MIFIDAQTLEDLSTYDGLLRSIASWLNRDDLTDRIPYFVKLAEARLRRKVRNPEREVLKTFTPASGITLPDDFDSVRLLTVPQAWGSKVVEQVSPEEFYSQTRYAGQTPVYTIIANKIVLAPLPSSESVYSAALAYTAGIPDLSATVQTNWLLTKHPDIYLFASLVQAEFYGWNDDRLPLIKGALDEMLEELENAGLRKRYGGGPLTMRTHAAPNVRGAYRG